MLDLPEAVSIGRAVLLAGLLAALALVVFAVARFWWRLDRGDIEAEAGGSYGDQFSGDDFPDDK